MTLISAVNFRRHSTSGVEGLILERLIQAGFSLEISIFIIQTPAGVDVYTETGIIKTHGIIYLKVGDIIFLSSELEDILDGYLSPELLKKVIFLNSFDAFMNHPNNLLYTLTQLTAISSIDLTGKVILDLGCAEGCLGLLALKKGAARVYGVDINEKAEELYFKNLELNNFKKEASDILIAGFNQRQLISESLPAKEIEVVFVNIGPHYGASDLEAYSLLDLFPNAKTVVAGGYNFSVTWLNSTRALLHLGKFGFKKGLGFYIPKYKAHTSFVISR